MSVHSPKKTGIARDCASLVVVIYFSSNSQHVISIFSEFGENYHYIRRKKCAGSNFIPSLLT